MNELRPALVVFGLLTVLTGIAYPLVVTGIGQAAFHDQVNGSIRAVRRSRSRLTAARPAVLGSEVLLEQAVGDGPAAVQRCRSRAARIRARSILRSKRRYEIA
jgi:hypothetical protein